MQRARWACSFVREELGGHSTERAPHCPKALRHEKHKGSNEWKSFVPSVPFCGLIAEPPTQRGVVDDDRLRAFRTGGDEANLNADLL